MTPPTLKSKLPPHITFSPLAACLHIFPKQIFILWLLKLRVRVPLCLLNCSLYFMWQQSLWFCFFYGVLCWSTTDVLAIQLTNLKQLRWFEQTTEWRTMLSMNSIRTVGTYFTNITAVLKLWKLCAYLTGWISGLGMNYNTRAFKVILIQIECLKWKSI